MGPGLALLALGAGRACWSYPGVTLGSYTGVALQTHHPGKSRSALVAYGTGVATRPGRAGGAVHTHNACSTQRSRKPGVTRLALGAGVPLLALWPAYPGAARYAGFPLGSGRAGGSVNADHPGLALGPGWPRQTSFAAVAGPGYSL